MEKTSIPKPLRILHLEDSLLDHQLLKRELEKSITATSILRVETLERFRTEVAEASFDVILADYKLVGFTAFDAWAELKNDPHKTPFILVSGAIGESAAVSAINEGMSDYVLKDELHRLEHVITRALEVHRIKVQQAQTYRELIDSEKRLAAFSEHLQSTIEAERASIAREIHDDIGGTLAAAKLDLSWISRHTTEATIQSHAVATIDMLDQAIGASQRIMMNLRPAILDQGLVPAVRWLASAFERRTDIKTVVIAPELIACADSATQLAAYRTAQEALTNIQKHSRCTKAILELSDLNGVLTLEISDNGIGLTQSEREKPTSFGLRGLNERARSVGGWLDVVSLPPPASGTSIILSVPLAAKKFRCEADET